MSMNNREKVLIVDDHASICVVLQDLLQRQGYLAATARNYDEAVPVIEGDDISVVITDLKMPGKSGMDLLAFARVKRPEIPVIMITGHGNIEDAVRAMRQGAFDFITKPVDETEQARRVPAVERAEGLLVAAGDHGLGPPAVGILGRLAHRSSTA